MTTSPNGPAPRSGPERRRHVLERLATEQDVWVATAGPGRRPYLVPLSLHWDGTAVWLATRAENPTGRNLRETGRTRLSLAATQDVVMIEGSVEAFALDQVEDATADAYAARCGWDPRRGPGGRSPYLYFRVVPTAVEAFAGVGEHSGRHLMRDGAWLV